MAVSNRTSIHLVVPATPPKSRAFAHSRTVFNTDAAISAGSRKQESTRTAELTRVYFKEAADLWLDSRKMFWSPRTYKDAKYYVETLSKFFGEFRLTEITPDLLRAYQKIRRERVNGRKINQEIGYLAQMLKRIGRWPDLAVDYQPLKVSRQSPGRALSEAEYERLTRHAMSRPEWEGAYLFMILSTNGESARRRTRFRSEAEHHSVVIPNSIPF